MSGFIQIGRELQNHWIRRDKDYWMVFCEMYFLARFSEKPEVRRVDGIDVTVHHKEFIFGGPSWCRRLDISEQRLKTLIKKMVSEGLIKRTQKFNKFTVYSFEYGSATNQQNNQQSNQQKIVDQPAETHAGQGIGSDANQQKFSDQPAGQPAKQPMKEKGIKEKGSKEECLKPIRGEIAMAMTEEAKGILAYLNEKKGSKFRATPNTLKLIQGRLNEGYTVEECKHVISVKVAEWIGTDNEKYLDYETLFRPSKFPKYLEQKMNQVATKKNDGYKNKSQQTADDYNQLKDFYMEEVNGGGGNNKGRDSRVVVDDQNRLPEFR